MTAAWVVLLLVGAGLLAAGVMLERGQRRHGGGQRIVRNAPRPKVQDRIPDPPPRGRS